MRRPAGTAPGTIAIDPNAPPPAISVIAYGPDDHVAVEIDDPDDLAPYLDDHWSVVWVNVDGLGDEGVLHRLGERFHVHRLALEDVVHVHQRAKVEPYDEHLFIVGRMVHAAASVETEQVSLFLGDRFVLTFQEHAGDSFDLVRQRIAGGRPKIRGSKAGYLCYALLDALVDAYFPVLEGYGERLEALEGRVLARPDETTVQEIFRVRRDLLTIRRAVWPHREAIGTLLRDDSPFIDEGTRVYLRDVYDHVVHLVDMVETYRELASGLMDLYLSSVGNRMNEVMKVLTIFAAIFIPLSFIAGLYGMNFDPASPFNMPELRWRFGYPVALGVMSLVAGGLLLFFRHKGWIGKRGGGP